MKGFKLSCPEFADYLPYGLGRYYKKPVFGMMGRFCKIGSSPNPLFQGVIVKITGIETGFVDGLYVLFFDAPQKDLVACPCSSVSKGGTPASCSEYA